ncbi:TatD family deoxyribonuclease [Psychromonas sp. B3M02]|uniref:TatD family hydrolase n=1 Tax=Psychromonas sp. B3M02 TaxID=2267226 RepID=UPI000DE805A6|nr:TatD family hydrolase [Psychromonas sp. B3M02]RBW42743.1 TatD family deoxyribonuclease [Psychromonas sp. B3M02]
MFIDSHCHLNFDCFKQDLATLLAELKSANITQVIIPATDAARWPEIITLCEKYAELYFALGIHPHFLSTFKAEDLVTLESTLLNLHHQAEHHCIALGEIGLDKLIDTSMETQEAVFLAQLAIAQRLQLPVILHVVKTQSRILQLLKQTKFSYGGVYHAFSGSEEIANEFIKLGFKLGIGGVITHPTAKKTQKTLSKLPLSSLVLETDAPDMPVYQQSTEFNSPLNITVIFEALCALREEPRDVIAQRIYNNSKSIFPIIND